MFEKGADVLIVVITRILKEKATMKTAEGNEKVLMSTDLPQSRKSTVC